MKKKITGLFTASVAVALLMPSIAQATLGMDLIGFGAKSRGMGGVGVAYAQDSLSIAYNPANAGSVGESRLDLGGEIFNPRMGIKHDSVLLGIDDENSKYEYFPMPFIGYVEKIDDELAWGIAVVGAGLITSFDQPNSNPNVADTFFNFNSLASDEAGVTLVRMLMLPTLSYKTNDQLTVGVSLAVGIQAFRAKGLQAFGRLGFSDNVDALTNNGTDYSYGLGVKLGLLWEPIDDLTIGLNYSPRMNMSKFDKYKGLFAEQGDFDIAEDYSVGIAYRFTPEFKLTVEVKQTNYADVKSLGNPGPDASDPSGFFSLCPGADVSDCKTGGDLGLGFGWKNLTAYKIGGDYKYSNKITLRAGWAYAKAPIPKDQVLFNMLAPATIENNLTLGASYQYADDIEISVNYLHGFANTIKGPTVFGPTQAIVQGSNAAISMVQDAIGVMVGLKF